MRERFAGIVLTDDYIQHKDGSGPVAGARATVDTAGQMRHRITATRLVLTGPLALAWRKKKDDRELFLTVEGQGFAICVAVDPRDGKRARQFAARINSLASKASQSLPAPPSPPTPPERAEMSSVADELRKLADLHAAGMLTSEEFETQKRRLLG